MHLLVNDKWKLPTTEVTPPQNSQAAKFLQFPLGFRHH